MKKLILLALLVISVSLSAQNSIFLFDANTLIATDGINTIERSVDVRVSLNFKKEQCIIYTKETQIIDFKANRTYIDEDNYKVIECTATDSNYKNIRFNILYNSKLEATLFQIVYSDLVYVYICTLVKE